MEWYSRFEGSLKFAYSCACLGAGVAVCELYQAVGSFEPRDFLLAGCSAAVSAASLLYARMVKNDRKELEDLLQEQSERRFEELSRRGPQ